MISKIEAIVLKAIDYSETSQIVWMYTRELGRISAMARGARRPKSKFGSTLQPMSHVQAVVYNKEGSQILPLSETSHHTLRRNLSRDLEKIAVGLRVVELVRGLTQEHDRNEELFDLLIATLDRLNSTERRTVNVLLFFQMQLAFLLGIGPDIVKDDVQAIDGDGYLALDTGAVSADGSRGGKRASRQALRTFAILSRADAQAISRLEITPKVRREVSGLIDAYFQFHFDSAYPNRSEKVISRLLDMANDDT
ncbi:MAG: DNA repair protein RecO [Rhodothermales bacterium]|nr:DNA repair protein RecO [Rhodothermales bacterium]